MLDDAFTLSGISLLTTLLCLFLFCFPLQLLNLSPNTRYAFIIRSHGDQFGLDKPNWRSMGASDFIANGQPIDHHRQSLLQGGFRRLHQQMPQSLFQESILFATCTCTHGEPQRPRHSTLSEEDLLAQVNALRRLRVLAKCTPNYAPDANVSRYRYKHLLSQISEAAVMPYVNSTVICDITMGRHPMDTDCFEVIQLDYKGDKIAPRREVSTVDCLQAGNVDQCHCERDVERRTSLQGVTAAPGGTVDGINYRHGPLHIIFFTLYSIFLSFPTGGRRHLLQN